MTHILTLVASDPKKPITNDHLGEINNMVEAFSIEEGVPQWLSPDKALSLSLSDAVSITLYDELREVLGHDEIDFFITKRSNRKKKLLLADMDSTIVEGETLDDLAEFAGIKEQIAKITTRAMEGRLDFHEALRERVELLKGLEESALHQTLQNLKMNAGAQQLVQTMSKHGAICVLVSGGFTFFTGAVAQRAGFHHHHGNILGLEEGRLSGQVENPILDKLAKVEFLKHYMRSLSLEPAQTLTIGDGANDIPMLEMAGLGIGYQPKPPVAEALQNLIIHGDLSAALYAQGYEDKDWA